MPTDRTFERAIVLALGGLGVLAPIASGAVAPWARAAVAVAAGCLVALWLLAAVARGELRVSRHPGWLAIALIGVVVAVQLGPSSWLGAVQPQTVELARTNGGAATAFTVDTDATRGEALRCLAIVAIFFVSAHVLRSRRRIAFVFGALLVGACIQLGYGAFERFSGRGGLLFEPHRYASAAVTGTYLNKNHFAGLLEMLVPVALGALLALRGDAAARVRSLPTRLARAAAHPHRVACAALALIAVALVLGVVLSLSRGGVVALVAGIATFALLGLVALGARRAIVVPLGVGAAAIALGAFFGLGRAAAGLRAAATGQAAQWHDRLDLWESGVAYAADHAWFGTGLGTFGRVFPIYQSSRFGDRWTDYLHNDWLQIACEIGLVGVALVALTLLLFGTSVVRGIVRRTSAPERWLAIGATGGVVAMLVHSVADYNLSRITANGIVFALLIACGWRAIARQSDGRADAVVWPTWRMSVQPVAVRSVLALAAIAVPVGVGFVVAPDVRADVAFNRYVASTDGRTRDYFVLPIAAAAPDRALESLHRAADARPSNATYRYRLGEAARARAAARVAAAARARAVALAGAFGDDADVDALARSLESTIAAEPDAERDTALDEAERHYRAAIRLAPTVADHHAGLAETLVARDPASVDAVDAMHAALALAPRRPARRFAMARVEAAAAEARGAPIDEAKLCDHLRIAVRGDTAYASRAYALLAAAGAPIDSFERITPRTVPGYGNLAIALEQARDWPRFEHALAVIDELSADEPDTRVETARRRCTVTALRGRFVALPAAIDDYIERLRAARADDVAAVAALRRRGRSEEALARVEALLVDDPRNADLLLIAAELATLPGLARPSGSSPLDALARSARVRVRWTQAALARTRRVARLLPAEARDPVVIARALARGERALGLGGAARRRLLAAGVDGDVVDHGSTGRIALAFGACATLLDVEADGPRIALRWRIDEPWPAGVRAAVAAVDDGGRVVAWLATLDAGTPGSARVGDVVVQHVAAPIGLRATALRIEVAPAAGTTDVEPLRVPWNDRAVVIPWPGAGMP